MEWCDRKYNLEYMKNHQEEIRARHKMRMETLEDIYYGIENGTITKVEEVKNKIDKNLLGDF